MLIKVYPYDLKDGNHSYINTDQIRRIDVGKGRTIIWLVMDSEEITVTLDEWQRIAPLLTGDTPTLPADVIEAQSRLLGTISHPYNTDMLFDAAYYLMTTVGKYIPNKETDK